MGSVYCTADDKWIWAQNNDLAPCFQSILISLPSIFLIIFGAIDIFRLYSYPRASVNSPLTQSAFLGIRFIVLCNLCVLHFIHIIVHLFSNIFLLYMFIQLALQLLAWCISIFLYALEIRRYYCRTKINSIFWAIEGFTTLKIFISVLAHVGEDSSFNGLIIIYLWKLLASGFMVYCVIYSLPIIVESDQWWSMSLLFPDNSIPETFNMNGFDKKYSYKKEIKQPLLKSVQFQDVIDTPRHPLSVTVVKYSLQKSKIKIGTVWGLYNYATYCLSVKWDKKTVWSVWRRYSDFLLLRRLIAKHSGWKRIGAAPLGIDGFWCERLDKSFLQKRVTTLNIFIQALVRAKSVLVSPIFVSFVSTGKKVKKDATFNTNLTVDDFELLSVVGKGSFGKVMQVRKKDTGKIYAMKVLKKKGLQKRIQIMHTKTEREVLAKIDHPFIVSLRFAFQTRSKLFMVLDFFNGGELFFHLHQGKFTEERAKFYIAEITLAIECLHQNGIVYRDLKPENVLLDSEGHIRLTDFGLSKMESGSNCTTFCGTAQYLAPEVIRRNGYGKVVDWWALGILLFELLSCRPPFSHRNQKRLYDLILHAEVKFPSTTSEVAKDLINKLLERNPSQRLGFNGAEEIKSHDFFENIDWLALYQKKIPVPFKPLSHGQMDLSNIWEEFKSEIPQNTPNFDGARHRYFSKFTYAEDDDSSVSDEDFVSTSSFDPYYDPAVIERGGWPQTSTGSMSVETSMRDSARSMDSRYSDKSDKSQKDCEAMPVLSQMSTAASTSSVYEPQFSHMSSRPPPVKLARVDGWQI